jgi:hypothetical protein
MNLITIIGLPLVKTEFKVVQLYHHKEPIMICRVKQPDVPYTFEDILETYLKETKTQFDTLTLNPENPKQLFPVLEMKRVYEVVGFGFSEIHPRDKYLKIPYGQSQEYKLGPDYGFQLKLEIAFKKDSPYWENIDRNRHAIDITNRTILTDAKRITSSRIYVQQ